MDVFDQLDEEKKPDIFDQLGSDTVADTRPPERDVPTAPDPYQPADIPRPSVGATGSWNNETGIPEDADPRTRRAMELGQEMAATRAEAANATPFYKLPEASALAFLSPLQTTPEELQAKADAHSQDVAQLRSQGNAMGLLGHGTYPETPSPTEASSMTPASSLGEQLTSKAAIPEDMALQEATKNGLLRAAQDLGSPENLTIMGATIGAGAIPKVGQLITRAISGVFGAQGAKAVLDGYEAYKNATTPQEKGDAISAMLSGGFIAATAGGHAVKPFFDLSTPELRRPVIPEKAKPLVDAAERTDALPKSVAALKETAAKTAAETKTQEVPSAVPIEKPNEEVLRKPSSQSEQQLGLQEVGARNAEAQVPAGAREPARAQAGAENEIPLNPAIDQFLSDVNAGRITSTQDAQAFGETIRTPEEIARMKQEYERASAAGMKALKELPEDATPDQSQAAINAAYRPQMINEAIEQATGASAYKLKDAAKYRELMDAGQPAKPNAPAAPPEAQPLPEPAAKIVGEEQKAAASQAESAAPATPDTIETTPVDLQSGAPIEPKPAVADTPVPIGQGAGGAMRAGELNPPKPFKTSNKNAIVDAERKARGLPPMMDLERQSNQSAWDSAMRKIDENPQVQDELISELTTKPRALTPEENAMVTHRRIDLRNEYEKALHRWKDAFEHDDVVRAGEESSRVKEWGDKLADLENISKATGAESGRSLQARKMVANEDFSLAAMELRAMEAKGRNLTPEEHIELIKAQNRIAELQQKLDALESGREGKEVETQTQETMKEVEREAKNPPKERAPDSEETITGRIKAKFEKGEQNAVTPLVQQLARMLWERGVRTQKAMIDGLHDILKTIDPEFTRDQTQRAFSGYGNFKPLSKGEIDVGLRDLKGQTQQVLKIEALEARKPLEKTGQERRVASDEERRLIKQVNELKRKYGVVVTDPATQLKSALQSRKTYYEHRIADLQHEILTRERIVKTKSPSPTDPELDLMIAEKDRLQAEHDSIFPKREITDEQRLKQAITAADRNLAQWEVRLTNAEKGVFDSRVPGRKVTSPELELIQAEAAAIREHVKELKDFANPKKTAEERALQSLKTRLANQTVELRRRLAEGDFAKRERKSTPLDAEANRLKAERDLAKEEFQAGLERDQWNKTSVFGKTKARLGGVYDLIKTIMSTGEFSFVLRQGKGAFFEAIFSPKRAVAFAKAFRDGIRAMRSPLEQRIVENEIFNDPMYPQALRDKLAVPEHGSKLSKQEEFAMGRYSDAIPGVSAFNRAGETFLKKVRFDNYKLMSKAMTESGTVTPEEGRIIAAFINEQTGRGGLGAAEPAAVLLNRVFFSPRYLMSRLQIASGHQIWSGTWKGTGRARKAVAGSYARMLIGAAAYYTLLYGFFNRGEKKATIESDPRSTDFGKLRMGETRLDPMAGIAQVSTMAARTITGESKDSKGRVFPIVGKDKPFGKDDWVGYAARFARSKLHPTIGGAIDLRMGKNMIGEESTLTSKLQESGPMTYYDIYEALRAQDMSDGAALSLLAFLGEGLQTYKTK